MIIENEIWKDIPGYKGYYQVSNYGNFRSLNRIIKYKNNGFSTVITTPNLKLCLSSSKQDET